MPKTKWTIDGQKSDPRPDIPVTDFKFLPFDTLFNPDKNPLYKSYLELRQNFCPTCLKIPEITEQDT